MQPWIVSNAHVKKFFPGHMYESFLVVRREHGANISRYGHALSPAPFEVHNVLASQIDYIPFLYASDFGHRCCKYQVSKELFVEAYGHSVKGEDVIPSYDAVSVTVFFNQQGLAFRLLVLRDLSFFGNWVLAAEFCFDADQDLVGNDEHDVRFGGKRDVVFSQQTARGAKRLIW